MASRVEVAGVFSALTDSRQRSGDLNEYVVLVNTGDEPANLAGWVLSNLKSDQKYHFPYLFPSFLSNGEPWVMEPGAMVIVNTGRGANGATATPGEGHQYHLYQHRQAPIWVGPGDRVCLSDRSGMLISALDLPVQPRTR